MSIREVRGAGWRPIGGLQLAPLYTVTLLTGGHGSGTTTVIESVHMLARLGSARRHAPGAKLSWPGERSTEGWQVEARLAPKGGRAPKGGGPPWSGRAAAQRPSDSSTSLTASPRRDGPEQWLPEAISQMGGGKRRPRRPRHAAGSILGALEQRAERRAHARRHRGPRVPGMRRRYRLHRTDGVDGNLHPEAIRASGP